MSNLEKYDAVIIGAGNGGLTAAATLARGGAKTLLLERHNIPGGCATSFVRGDFEFEVALHQLSGLGTEKNPFIMRKIFNELGVMDKVEFVEEHHLYRMTIKDEFDITLPASWKGIREVLIENFPDEEQGIKDYMLLCERVVLESFMGFKAALKMNSEDMLMKNSKHYAEHGLRSAKSVLDKHFSDEQLKTLLAAYWCYLGQAPRNINFVDLAMMLYAYGVFKPWHIEGGSQALSNALLESFLEAGGEVQFNAAVDQIITDKSGDKPKVIAIRTEHGDVYETEQVISNASSVVTFVDLLDTDELPEGISQDFKSREIGTSAFCLYIGLDCPPETLGIKNASTFMGTTMDEDLMVETMATLNPPVATMLTCYNVDDPSFAPPGKSQVSLLCLQYGKVWDDVPVEDYADTKYAFAEHLIEQAEEFFPGFRSHIEEIEVATPLTMQRYLNTPGGSIYGFIQNPEDGEIHRPRYDQVEGLHMAGCWQGMGGFQPTYMVGQSTAKAVLKKLKAQRLAEQDQTQTQDVKEPANV
ncbi:phytoene dehydrogenase [Oleiphilus sp. HI0125]|uniref:phytoene desaturase family protein n=3 Tax=Oleiphilus sp. HI0125 TaxID=1822266 RepID=UPI0007C2CC39|nr:NAD(P)/FAD-dependent oxidoreductase [Oleiphilus sp. HI0125]KZZ58825.1 phytoene dehydrogenase [Oleiphilus sp. HI0125]